MSELEAATVPELLAELEKRFHGSVFVAVKDTDGEAGEDFFLKCNGGMTLSLGLARRAGNMLDMESVAGVFDAEEDESEGEG